MRLIHTADWHLGKLLHGVRLTDDQSHVLDQFVGIARNFRPDAILISGDIYDRAVPPPEAVELLDNVLSRLVQELPDTAILMIAGNHDSPERLEFGSRLFEKQKLYVYGNLPQKIAGIRLRDEHGPVWVYGLPFAEPPVVRQRCVKNGSDVEVIDHDSAARALLDEIRLTHPMGERAVVLAHAFVAGEATSLESDSERPLFLGGSGTVNVNCFQGFHYVALGHLHRPQQIGTGRVRYSGSLLKYSFSESTDTKGVLLIEMNAKGDCIISQEPLIPRRDMRQVRAYFRDLENGSGVTGSSDDYLEITLLDEVDVLDPVGRLRPQYPNILNVRRDVVPDSRELMPPSANARELQPAELFSQFWAQAASKPLTEDQLGAFTGVVEKLAFAEREATL